MADLGGFIAGGTTLEIELAGGIIIKFELVRKHFHIIG